MSKQDEEKAEELYPDFERDLLYQNRVKKMQRKAFIQGAAWKEQQMIEKAVKFIDENMFGMLDDGVPYIQSIHDTSKNEFIEDLKMYMEEN